MMNNKRAFTLIELLVVISIIALLATIILPSLGMAKRYAKRVHCLSNLHAIGIGWKMYLDEYPGTVPQAKSLPDDRNDAQSIVKVMEKFVEDEKVWNCLGDDNNHFVDLGTSYEYWVGLGLEVGWAVPNFEQQMQTVLSEFEKAPHLIPVIMDANPYHPTTEYPDGKQAAYYDGHADWFDPDELEKQAQDYF